MKLKITYEINVLFLSYLVQIGEVEPQEDPQIVHIQ